VADTRFQVTQVRGFEKFTEGRPFYEMPGITSRICGICPISHQLAASKACDAIMAVRIPKAARLLREIIHCGQLVQSHALSFFYLSGPDLLLGMDSDPATRNVAGLIEANPELARAGIELRKFGLQVIEGLAEERVHASWIVPGGVKTPMPEPLRDRLLAGIPEALDTTPRARPVQEQARRIPGGDRELRLRAHDVRLAGGRRGQPATLRRRDSAARCGG
jgi:NAD-reducing hydrogenase large subunit